VLDCLIAARNGFAIESHSLRVNACRPVVSVANLAEASFTGLTIAR
jgi:hypothetical protein